MTFIYELVPYSLEICRMCENELHSSSLSKAIVHLVTYGHFRSRDKDGGAVTPFDPS